MVREDQNQSDKVRQRAIDAEGRPGAGYIDGSGRGRIREVKKNARAS
jgi:hypothetical protein